MITVLASAKAVALNGTVDNTPNPLPECDRMEIAVNVSAACTISVWASYDGKNWLQNTLPNSQTKADIVFAGAGTLLETVTPAPFIQLKASAAVTLTAAVIQPNEA